MNGRLSCLLPFCIFLLNDLIAVAPHKLSSLQIIDSWPHQHHMLQCPYVCVPHKFGSLAPIFQQMGLIWLDIMKYVSANQANSLITMLNASPENIVPVTFCTCLPSKQWCGQNDLNAVQMTHSWKTKTSMQAVSFSFHSGQKWPSSCNGFI